MQITRTVFNVVARPAEEGGYWAEVIELPGCVTQGETKEELFHNVVEAIKACLAAYEEEPDSGYQEPSAELWGVPMFDEGPEKKSQPLPA